MRTKLVRPFMGVFIFFFCIVDLTCGQVSAQTLPPENPIAATVPTTGFSLELEDVIRIPNSAGQTPRLQMLEPMGDGSGKLLVGDQRGKIYSFTPGDSSPTLFFDVASALPSSGTLEFVGEADAGGEKGLRGFAFHPQAFQAGVPGYRKFYTAQAIDDTSGGSNHHSSVIEWTLNANGTVNTSSERLVIKMAQPHSGHNIGKIGFNPTAEVGDSDYGNLFIAMGDSGNLSGFVFGQDMTTVLGKMLRIDPLSSGADPYTIPSDNPFVGQSGILDEIWASGLRNPHAFSWDRGGDHKLLISDIGQSNIEEVNLGVSGANYGWYEREGAYLNRKDLYPANFGPPNVLELLPTDHATDEYTYPVAQYDHNDPSTNGEAGSHAVAGGYVYRGSRVPQLYGKYLFGDFAGNSGPLFVVDVDDLIQRDDFANINTINGGLLAPFEHLQITYNGQPTTMLEIIQDASGNNSLSRTDIRFGLGPDGEVYVMNKKDGWIRRFAATSATPGDFNYDEVVDGADLALWQEDFGLRDDSDADGDGDSDGQDYLSWQRNLSSASSGSVTVPEPVTAFLGLAGVAVLISRRQRKGGVIFSDTNNKIE